MAGASSDWKDGLERWLHGGADRARRAPGDYDQLHHFVAAGVWDASPLEAELLRQADKLVGDGDAVLMIDDTALPKKGNHSVGVCAPICGCARRRTARPWCR